MGHGRYADCLTHAILCSLAASAMALATILERLLIVVMGAVMMLIAMAKLLPIIRLNQFVK